MTADHREADLDRGRRTATHELSGRPYVVVSSDTHASPDDLDHFLSYVDPGDRTAVAAFGDMSSVAIPVFGGKDPGVIDDPDPVRAVATRRLAGMNVDVGAAAGWLAHYGTDWVIPGDGNGRRLQVLEDQGIHAEVTLPGPVLAGGLSPAMYLGGHAATGLEVVWPAAHAYNRWLADFCAAAPGRRAGCIVLDLHDLERAVEEIAWARNAGLFGGVMLPAMSVRSGLPGYADRYYDPLWSACEDYKMVVTLHTGASGTATDTKYLYDKEHGGYLGLYEVFVFTRRPLWFMVFGGVFDRHPRLQVAIVENGVQWLPSLVRDMEQFFDTHGGAPVRSFLKERPGDYIRRHLWVGGSLMKRYEAEMRHEIGVDRLMWGADYPHLEGAAPIHREVLAHIFGGMPEDELRRILGGNAIDLWGFDGALLQAVADRVGPTVDDLARQLSLAEMPETFSWSLARPVPLSSPSPAAGTGTGMAVGMGMGMGTGTGTSTSTGMGGAD
jgi:predicted TIM-barrel fold metal-dependent hydrolase